MIDQLKAALGDWLEDVTLQNSIGEAGYAHGKLVFDILTMAVGISELNAFFKTGKLSIAAVSIIKALSKVDRILVREAGVWKKLTELPVQVHHLLTRYG